MAHRLQDTLYCRKRARSNVACGCAVHEGELKQAVRDTIALKPPAELIYTLPVLDISAGGVTLTGIVIFMQKVKPPLTKEVAVRPEDFTMQVTVSGIYY